MERTLFEEVEQRGKTIGEVIGETIGEVIGEAISEAVGKVIGKSDEFRRHIRNRLEKKVGPLGPQDSQRLEEWAVEKLKEVSLALMDAKSLNKLRQSETG